MDSIDEVRVTPCYVKYTNQISILLEYCLERRGDLISIKNNLISVLDGLQS